MKKSIYLNETSTLYLQSQWGERKGRKSYSCYINEALYALSKLRRFCIYPEELLGLICECCDLVKPHSRKNPINLAKEILEYYNVTVTKELPQATAEIVERLAAMNEGEQFVVLLCARVYNECGK